MYGRSRVNVEVEPRSTFMFTRQGAKYLSFRNEHIHRRLDQLVKCGALASLRNYTLHQFTLTLTKKVTKHALVRG